MRSAIRCPLCGSEAQEEGIRDPELWDDPYCPRCAKPLTPEGLLIEEQVVGDSRVIREVGKGGIVIWEYPAYGDRRSPSEDDAKRFLQRIQELEQESEDHSGSAVSTVHSQAKWNKKAAARRFRRWFYMEFENRPLEISDPTLRKLASRILKKDKIVEHHSYEPLRDEIENKERNFRERINYYRIRASVEEPLILSRLSPAARLMIIEAQDAFCFGLFRAVAAICRALLEDAIRDVVRRLPNAPEPIEDTNLRVLIDCVPKALFHDRARSWAHELRENGNAAVRDASCIFDEKAAWKNLVVTTLLVQMLLEGGERLC